MPPRIPSTIRLSTRCLRDPPPLLVSRTRLFNTRPRAPSPQPSTAPHNPLDPIARHRLETQVRAHYTRRNYYAATGAALCILATLVLVSTYELPPKPEQCDTPPRRDPSLERGAALVGNVSGGAEVRIVGAGPASRQKDEEEEEEEEVQRVPTGTSSVPSFPQTLSLPGRASSTSPALPVGTGDADEPYQLVGLGIRTVSFLSIQVYVVGLYVARSDIATLQARLVRAAAGTDAASTLVAGEKDALRAALLDPLRSEQLWDGVLREGGIRSVLRIVPTRNTDFAHLRDGWVRGITARSQRPAVGEETFEDEGFGEAVGGFKALFGRGGVPKGKALMLERGGDGVLGAWVEGEKGGWERMGEVRDERVGRLVWLGYLGGKKVASEEARRSVVEGVMAFVERPVGTVETQVV
ncbi:Altered inheritance of mitochondria protein 18 mitochondrial [Xylographa carneopallida]|nr:Altered inheritance of mitochondria protein 18 mitochondrial [Xylographa carneopallida]